MSPALSPRWLWPGIALAAGVAGISAVWVAVAMLSGSSASWLGLVAAVDVALLLRLTAAPPGAARVVASVLATMIAIALSYWILVATQLGLLLGMPPIASSLRLGPHLFLALGARALSRVDLVLLAAAPVLAAILAQAPRPASPADAGVSDRRPAP